MAIRPKELPETTTNWAEADWKGHQKSVVQVKSGHTIIIDEPVAMGGTNEGTSPMGYLFASLAGCTAVIVERVADGLGVRIDAMKIRTEGTYSPRGIGGQEGYQPAPTQVETIVTMKTSAPDEQIEALKREYFRRCPIFNLFKNSGCKMVDRWNIER